MECLSGTRPLCRPHPAMACTAPSCLLIVPGETFWTVGCKRPVVACDPSRTDATTEHLRFRNVLILR